MYIVFKIDEIELETFFLVGQQFTRPAAVVHPL